MKILFLILLLIPSLISLENDTDIEKDQFVAIIEESFR